MGDAYEDYINEFEREGENGIFYDPALFENKDPEKIIVQGNNTYPSIRIRHTKLALEHLAQKLGTSGPFTIRQFTNEINLVILQETRWNYVLNGFLEAVLTTNGWQFSLTTLGKKNNLGQIL